MDTRRSVATAVVSLSLVGCAQQPKTGTAELLPPAPPAPAKTNSPQAPRSTPPLPFRYPITRIASSASSTPAA
jgi:hypothetical protein